jgi:hypothetical protein
VKAALEGDDLHPLHVARIAPTSPQDDPETAEARAAEQRARIDDGRARQGRIVLRTPARKAAFVAGLAGIVALGLALVATV